MWTHLLMGAGILTVVVVTWFLAHYWLSPHVQEPDGHARVTGACQDIMELSLRFRNNRVTETAYWTSGCTYSLNCIAAAAQLVKGKTPDEALAQVGAAEIQAAIGGLPQDHMHCAVLAADTLEKALGDYIQKKTYRKGATCPCMPKNPHTG